MKNKILGAVLIGSLLISGCNHETAAVKLDTQEQKESYSIGYNLGMNFKQNFESQKLTVDPNIVSKAFKDGLTNSPQISQEEQDTILQDLQKRVTEAMQKEQEAFKQEQQKLAEINENKEIEFLLKNKKNKGVITTKSGLQYQILKKGNGKSFPSASDKVTVHYKGSLLDGTQFDSSYDRNQPASFPVGQVIEGWTEALQKMSIGAKWKLFIPSKLAYGITPPPGSKIQPNSTLLFEVELISINK
ncbi:hypothetical protein DID75_01440 [Candidatus Marinamargulisbacteria bacterium SCGC AG-410-N11]|nr:hypothetical protein DID75_01440 [Candidatus Marinamargulisbacteria bacterium SCGC AG-410-N11]